MSVAAGWNLRSGWVWNARTQCGMRPSMIVMSNDFFQDDSQVPYVHR